MIEYERKLLMTAPLAQSCIVADVSSGQPIADYFPPGDAAYFAVRYRTQGLTDVTAALSGLLASATLTVKGRYTPGQNGRPEQNHTAIVRLAGVPCVVKHRLVVRGVILPDGLFALPPQVIGTLDLFCSAWQRPCFEIEAAPGEADGPAMVEACANRILAALPSLYSAPDSTYKAPPARPLGADWLPTLANCMADQLRILRGEPAQLVGPWTVERL